MVALGIFLLSLNANLLMVSPSTATGCVFTEGAAPTQMMASLGAGAEASAPMSLRCKRVRWVQRWVAAGKS